MVRTVLRLLLDRSAAAPADVPWDDWVPMLERNAVLLRVVQRLEALHRPIPPGLAVAALRERARVARVLHLMRQIADACDRHGVPHVFPKAFAHYPDAGSDIDLLVPLSSDVDPLLLRRAHLVPEIGSASLLSASRVYRLPDHELTLDIHHGRVGRVGEHRDFAMRLIRNRQTLRLAGAEWWAPTAEDELVFQGFERVAGRRSFRIGDVVNAVGLVQRHDLDWDVVRETARITGALPHLSCYLAYIAQIHRDVLGRALSLPPLGTAGVAGWGRAEFTRGAFRFPTLRVSGALYARAFGLAIAQGRLAGAGRLLLLPLVAAAAVWRRMAPAIVAGGEQ
jgi:hypothetical protein